MNNKLLAVFGLKWNPFSPDVPIEALHLTPKVENFCWRTENLAREGGFALVSGEPGGGKSDVLRLLVERLTALRDVKAGLLTPPRAKPAGLFRGVGGLPPAPRPAADGAARRESGPADSPAGQARRLLPRDGGPLQRAASAPQPLGRLKNTTKKITKPHQHHPLPNNTGGGRGAGDTNLHLKQTTT